LIRDPHYREPADQIAPPIGEQQLVLHDRDKDRRDIVTEAILTREQVKELSLIPTPASLAAAFTVLTRFAKYFLVRYGPGDAGHRYRQ
jgi:hypothetical protein